MSSFVVMHHIPWNTFNCSVAQCFHYFVMVFNYCLLSFFSGAAENKHSYLVEIPVELSIFECSIQKSFLRSLQVILKNRNM